MLSVGPDARSEHRGSGEPLVKGSVLATKNETVGSGWWSNWPFSDFLRYWDYRPSTSWVQHFITINNNAGDAPVEETVLQQVGSYGYQLSRILDAVTVVVDQLEKSQGLGTLTTEQQQSIANLKQLASDVNTSVSGYWARH